ncbi:MAG: hypothetical protein ABGW69_04150 [Nanoarchaeota archaeon]
MKIKNRKYRFLSKIILFFAVILLIPLSFASNIKYSNPFLEIKSIDPFNPKAGDLVKIDFRLTNNGDKGDYFYINFMNNSILNFVTISENPIYVPPYNYRDFTAYFKVNNNALSGSYPLIVKVKDSENNFEKTFTFFVNIKNKANLVLSQKSNICLLNSNCNLYLLLINQDFGKARNIVIKFSLPSKSIYLSEIKGNSDKLINTSIFIPEKLNYGLYLLKTKIFYLDENNNLIQKEEIIPLELKSNVNLEISQISYDRNNNYIKIKVENPGYGKANNIVINVYIPKLNLNKSFFIGTLNENEDSSIYFYLPKVNKKENLKLLINLKWDDYKEKTKNYTYTITVYSKESKNYMIYLITLILISGSTYFVYRQIKKKKNKSENNE